MVSCAPPMPFGNTVIKKCYVCVCCVCEVTHGQRLYLMKVRSSELKWTLVITDIRIFLIIPVLIKENSPVLQATDNDLLSLSSR